MKIIETDGFILKVVAIITMVIDHLSAALENNISPTIYELGRTIGRTSFPLFAYMIAVGYRKTKDKKKYLLRLLLVGILSEPFFDYLLFYKYFEKSYNNIFFTLFLGLLALVISGEIKKIIENKILKFAIEALIVLIISFFAEYVHTDYGFYGVFLIYTFHLYLEFRKKEFITIPFFYGITQTIFVFPAYILILLDNKKKGRHISKYFTYLFYPGHIIIAIILRNILNIN